MIGWEQTVRTGNPELDRQTIEGYRQQAHAQGLTLQEWPLPHGGVHVRAVPMALDPGYAPGYAPPYAPAQFPPIAQASPARAPVAPPVMTRARGCEVCGADVQTKHVTLLQNVGLLVIRMHKTMKGNLCKACIRETFWRYTTITFFFGWWGIISFFFSFVIIPANIITMIGARNLPEPSPAQRPRRA